VETTSGLEWGAQHGVGAGTHARQQAPATRQERMENARPAAGSAVGDGDEPAAMYQHSVINHSDDCCGFPRPQLDGSGRDNDNSSSGSKPHDELSARMVAG